MAITATEARERLVGAWTLLSFTTTVTSPTGTTTITHPMGSQPLGRLIFTSDGWISTFGNDPSKMLIPSTPWIVAQDEEIALVARNIMSYLGVFRIFIVDGEVRLETEVHVSLDPSWIGTKQERRVELKVEEGREMVVLRPVGKLPAPVS
jgi:hypothetical protein